MKALTQATQAPQFTLFILATLLFKFATGCVLLATSWVILNGGSPIGLAASAVLSFLPALLSNQLVRLVKGRSNKRLSAIATAACAALAGLAASMNTWPMAWMLPLLFLLWLAFFTFEAATEGWFVEATAGIKDRAELEKFSSLSMTVNQVSVMISPLLVGPIARHFGTAATFAVPALLYAGATIVALLASNKVANEMSQNVANAAAVHAPEQPAWRLVPLPVLITLALIWPGLAVFNMMAPLVAKQTAGNVDVAAWLDMAFGCGMALSGIFIGRAKSIAAWLQQPLVLTAIGAAALTAFVARAGDTVASIVSLGLLGVAFGASRIKLRTYLASTLAGAQARSVVAFANAASFPVILVATLAYGRLSEAAEPSTGLTVPTLTFALFFAALLTTGGINLRRAAHANA